jgi:iron complex transport system ATP-binding protein
MTMLEANKVSFSAGEVSILHDIDLHLNPGELLGLVGPNGAGKSTLLRIITGLLKDYSGTIAINGTPFSAIPSRQRARQIAYLAQESIAHWPLRVERLVELGRIPHLDSWHKPGERDAAVIKKVMANTDVTFLRNRTFNTLSGGERMRVLLARALAVEPVILLADEPVAALDPAHQLDVMALLRNHCDQGGSAIVVLHDLSLAAHYCHRLQLLHKGRTYATGAPFEVLSAENLEQVYRIRMRRDEGHSESAFLPWERVL